MKKIYSNLILVTVIGLMSVVSVMAGNSYGPLETVNIPKFNGSGYTSYQTKATTGSAGMLNTTETAGVNVDARILSSTNKGRANAYGILK